MKIFLRLYVLIVLMVLLAYNGLHAQQKAWPAVEDLPALQRFPDPLTMFDGTPVTSVEQWRRDRRPELISLFQYYMYGEAPPPPDNFRYTVVDVDPGALNGRATRKLITLHFGPEGTPSVSLLVLTPNDGEEPAPVLLGYNAAGNHSLMDDPAIPLTPAWINNSYYRDTDDNKAHEYQRGLRKGNWPLKMLIDRGYGVATMYAGEISPDYDGGWKEGVHKSYMKVGQHRPESHEWAVLAAWAWGLQRGVDYLVQDEEVNQEAIAVIGHSRRGKAALLAGALDERIAMVIPHQAGTGGTAPSRSYIGESVKMINRNFPHWFNGNFKEFNNLVERLPFDQHDLFSLIAPRPLLLTNATEDIHADPQGQFDMLKLTAPVYELLGVEGVGTTIFPEENVLLDSRLGYFIRPGNHSMTDTDWEAWLDFCDRHFTE
ncbi:MAG: hypothetical protein WD266_01230 [Balneolales bacterium]